MGVVRNIMVRAVADFSNLQTASNELQGNMNRMATNLGGSVNRMNAQANRLGGIGAAFGGLKRELLWMASMYIGVRGLKDATVAAMQYEAQMGNLTHILQDQTDSFVEWGDTQARMFGYGRSDVVKYGTQFANLVSTFTTGTDQIKSRTEKLLEVSAIISNGTGRSIDDVMERMRSGLLGNVQAINDLGIYANNSMIQTSKAFKEIADGRSWNKLTFQEKQQILYMSLMEQATQKYGNTMQQNTHLKVNQFLGVLKDLRVEMGNFILPILNAVLPGLNAFAMGLLKVMKIASQFSRAIFGKAIWGDTAKTQVQTDAINGQSGAVNNLTNSVKKLTKAKKESSNGVAGFDEVNTLSSSGASGVDDGGGSGIQIPAPDTTPFNNAVNDSNQIVQNISKAVQDFVDKVKGWLEPIAPYWDGVTSAVKDLWDAIVNLWESKGMQAFIGWLGMAAQWAIQKTLGLVQNAIDFVAQAINGVADALNGDWSGAWSEAKTMLDNLCNTFGDFTPLIAGVTAALIAQKVVSTVTALWTAYKEATTDMTLAQYALNVAMDANPVGLIAAAVGLLVVAGIALYQNWDKVTASFKAFTDWASKGLSDLGNIGTNIWNSVTSGWGDIKKWFMDNVVGNEKKDVGILGAIGELDSIGSKISGYITSGWGNITTWVSDKVVGSEKSKTGMLGAISSLSSVGSKIYGYLVTNWGNFTNWISVVIVGSAKSKTGMLGAVASLSNLGSTIWGYLTSGYGSVKTWFTNNIATPAHNALSGIGSGIGGAITNGLKSTWNIIADGINGLIDGLDVVWKAFTGHKTTIHHVPRIALAHGGVTNGPVNALIGDNPGGREIVSPLNKMQDYMASTVTNAIITASQLTGGQSNNRTNGDIILNIDGRSFARIIKPYQNLEQQRVGTNVRLQTI